MDAKCKIERVASEVDLEDRVAFRDQMCSFNAEAYTTS
jgi:hypothetical protein